MGIDVRIIDNVKKWTIPNKISSCGDLVQAHPNRDPLLPNHDNDRDIFGSNSIAVKMLSLLD